ncbi:MAG: PTS sugar transporter subunit IIB [Elusimicrobia bacterium]|nr:PTS sugar transporter subunit IIB [Elusimicrobiota bacterium]
MIQLFRIDSRLIHGQVVEGWLKYKPADEIIVVNNTIASDRFQAKILSIAVPEGVSFEVLTTEEFMKRFPILKGSTKKYLILIDSIKVIKQLIDLGLNSVEINLGLLNYEDDKQPLTRSIYINAEEKGILRKLIEKGVKIFIQTLPTDDKIPVENVLGKI